MDNQKYTTYLDIWNRLTTSFKHKEIQEGDVIAWCAECETEWIRDTEALTQFLKVAIPVVDYQAPVPCNVFRILDVYSDPNNNQSTLSYYNNGSYLIFNSDMKYTTIYMNYDGITVDQDSGYPLIKKGHEQACEAFCIWKLFYEDWLNNKIDNTKWSYIDDQKNIQIDAAAASIRDYDRSRLRNIRTIMNNMIPSIVNSNLKHNGIGE